MYVIVAKKKSEGTSRGYQRENNHVVVTAKDEVELKNTLNDLVSEGERMGHHEIISIIWKN